MFFEKKTNQLRIVHLQFNIIKIEGYIINELIPQYGNYNIQLLFKGCDEVAIGIDFENKTQVINETVKAT